SGERDVPEGAGGDPGARRPARPAAAHGLADAGVSRLLVIVAACLAAWGCAGRAPLPAAAPPPQFRFANDTFAFSNETVLEYDIDETTGHPPRRNPHPPPPFPL